MSDSDRKETTREEPERSSRRPRGARRRRKEESKVEGAKGSNSGSGDPEAKQPEAQSGPAKPASGGQQGTQGETGGEGFDESGKVSSMLETTGEDVKQLLKAADAASKQIREAAQTEAADSAAGVPGDGEESGSLVGRINKEVQEVLETADEAADKIREEARGEARHVIGEARRRAETVTKQQMDRVKEMTDQVLGELSGIQGRLERLQVAYDEAMKTMNADLGAQESKVWETQQNGEAESDKEAAAVRRRLGQRPLHKSAREPEEISEGARLLALQQMMAGVDPEVIEGRLRNEFGIEDPKPILDWMGLHGAGPAAAKQPKKR